MTRVKELANRLKANSSVLLTTDSALALGAFLHGYRVANDGFAVVLSELTDKFEGPDQADACTRAYLSIGDDRAAMEAVIEALGELNVRESAPAGGDAPPTTTFVDVVRESILDGRTGIVLLEPTVLWLADYASGYIAGLQTVAPAVGDAQERQLLSFEAWLRQEFDAGSRTPWYGIVRVYDGLCIEGLRAFLQRWDRFNAGR